MGYLTDRTFIGNVKSTDLIHVVDPTDVSQGNPDGSSYKASIQQVFDSLTGVCVSDFYVSNIHSCSPLYINPLDEGNIYFGSTNFVTIDLSNNRVGINNTSPTRQLDVIGDIKTTRMMITSPSLDNTENTLLVYDTVNGFVKKRDAQTLSSNNYTVTSISSSQSITWDYMYWGVNSPSSIVDITLPSTVGKDGYYLIIKDEAGTCGSYRIRLTPSSGVIDNNSYVDMNINNMSLTVMVRSNRWYII